MWFLGLSFFVVLKNNSAIYNELIYHLWAMKVKDYAVLREGMDDADGQERDQTFLGIFWSAWFS